MKYPKLLKTTLTGVDKNKLHSSRTFMRLYNIYIDYISLNKEYEYKYPEIYPYIKTSLFYKAVAEKHNKSYISTINLISKLKSIPADELDRLYNIALNNLGDKYNK